MSGTSFQIFLVFLICIPFYRFNPLRANFDLDLVMGDEEGGAVDEVEAEVGVEVPVE